MRKQELIHLHGLLAHIAEHLQSAAGVSIDLTAYDSQATSPTSIQQPKHAHKAATFALLNAITMEIGIQQAESSSRASPEPRHNMSDADSVSQNR